MFGELDDSDIYVNNQNDNFDEPLISEFAEDDVLANDTPADGPEVNDECANPQEKPKTDNSKLLIYVLVLILLVAGAAGAYFYKMKASQQDEIAVVGQETSEMGDFFYDKAKADGAAEETTVVDVELAAPAEQKAENAAAPAPGAKTEQKAEEKEFSPAAAVKEQAKKELEKKNKLMQDKSRQVVIPVTNGGRVNPFMPYNSALANAKPPEFDLIPPPLEVPEADPFVDNMVSTKISGIMYDSQRPSAIINCGGSDHLVHKGDKVQGYQVIDITKDRVVLKYGANIFRATVGQAIGGNGVVFNEVSNLNRQFGGAYSKTPSNVIEINGSN